MAIKPILFNTPMVRAVRSGIKTETRRLINPRYRDDEYSFQIITNAHTGEFVRVEMIDEWENCTRFLLPQYLPGDILWVRETWCDPTPDQSGWPILYKADMPMCWSAEETEHGEPITLREEDYRWRPSIHMPKEAAREFLRVTTVWAEQIQSITAAGIRAEGLGTGAAFCGDPLARDEFKLLWDSTVPKRKLSQCGWTANPWVWAYRFERCEKPPLF